MHEASKLAAQTDRIHMSLTRGQRAIGGLFAALGEEYPGHREFFRSAHHYGKVVTAYRTQPPE